MKFPLTQLSLIGLLSVFACNSVASAPVNEAYTDTLLQLAADTELASAQARAAKAQLNARLAKQKLIAPKQGQNAVERTTQSNAQSPRSPIDRVELKSLVTTHGVTTAFIVLEGELIEVKKGSNVGALTVVDLDDSSILFSDGKQQKRKWMAGFKTNPPASSKSARGN